MSSDASPPTFLNFRALIQARQAAAQHNLRPAGAQLVLEHIAGATNGAPAFPGYDALARATNLSVSVVRGYVHALVVAGYLTQTRLPNKHPGWDKPQWALGPLCKVTADSHFEVPVNGHSEVEVPADSHFKSRPAVTSSAGRQAPKRRESVDPGGPVVQATGGGKSGSVVKRVGEETAPLTPRPAKPTGAPRVRALIDALRGLGHRGIADALTPADKKATAEADFDPEKMAACMVDIATHHYGDPWIRERFGVDMILRFRYAGWLNQQNFGGEAAPAPNGFTGTVMRWMNEEEPSEEAPVRRTLPAPGGGL